MIGELLTDFLSVNFSSTFLLTEVEIPCCGANSFSSMIVLMRLEATNPFEKFDKESINPEIGFK